MGSFNGAKQYLRTLRIGVHQRAVLGSLHAQVQVSHETKRAAQLMKGGTIVIEGRTQKELQAVPLWQQGDAALATEDIMRARKALRHDPRVTNALHLFWECALRTDGHTAPHPHIPGEIIATRECYEAVFLRTFRVLIQGWDAEDALNSIAEDWEEDVRGEPGLTYVRFGDALFQVADMWTSAVGGSAYAGFLQRLFEDLSVGGRLKGRPDHLRCAGWKELDDCFFDEGLADGQLQQDGGAMATDRDEGNEALLGPSSQPESDSHLDGTRLKIDSVSSGRKMLERDQSRRSAAKRLQAAHRGMAARHECRSRKRAVRTIQSVGRARVRRRARARKAEEQVGHTGPVGALQSPGGACTRPASSPSQLPVGRPMGTPSRHASSYRRASSSPRESSPGQVGMYQPWRLRIEPVVPIDHDDTILARRAEHDMWRKQVEGRLMETQAKSAKLRQAAHYAKQARSEEARLARKSQELEESRQARIMKTLLHKDERTVKMAKMAAGRMGDTLAVHHSMDVSVHRKPSEALVPAQRADHEAYASRTRLARTQSFSSSTTTRSPPVKWRSTPSAPEAALHRIRARESLLLGHDRSTRSHMANGLLSEARRKGGGTQVHPGVTGLGTSSQRHDGQPQADIRSARGHQVSRRLRNPHPPRSSYWKVRYALEDLGVDIEEL